MMARQVFNPTQTGDVLCVARPGGAPDAEPCGHPLRDHGFETTACNLCKCKEAVPKPEHDYMAEGRRCPECGGTLTWARWKGAKDPTGAHRYDRWACAMCGHEWTPNA